MNARILYWGIEGAGKSANLAAIHAKLRPDHRGTLRREATAVDSTVHYELLPIQLGAVDGTPVEIEVTTAPSGPEQAPTRKQLLDEVSGVVVVVDATPERANANLTSCAELVATLESYGRDAADLPIVIQYNKRDLANDDALSDLQRQIALPATATFEAVATESSGVLETLTTVSKQVLKALREESGASAATRPTPEPAAHEAAPTPQPTEALAFEPTETPAFEPTETPAFEPAETPALEPSQTPARSEAPEPTPAPPTTDSLGALRDNEAGVALRERTSPADASARLLEDAIAAEAIASEVELETNDAFETAAHTSFDESFSALSSEPKPETRLSIGPDLRVVSVGTATRKGERSVRVPLVLGDAEGTTASLTLTLSLEALLDDSGD